VLVSGVARRGAAATGLATGGFGGAATLGCAAFLAGAVLFLAAADFADTAFLLAAGFLAGFLAGADRLVAAILLGAADAISIGFWSALPPPFLTAESRNLISVLQEALPPTIKVEPTVPMSKRKAHVLINPREIERALPTIDA
jgi:hypothetical protein